MYISNMLITILTVFATAISILVGLIYLYFKWSFTYWGRKKIPHSNPRMLVGDVRFDRNIGETFRDLYEDSSNEKLYGFWLLNQPILMVNDLDLVRRVLVQDFQSFHSRGTYINEKHDPLSNHIFSMEGNKWKEVRSKLSPTFTSGKMKNMYPLVEAIAKRVDKVLEPVAEVGGDFEARDMMGRYTTDVISSCIFGIETNSVEDTTTMFRVMGKKVFEPTRENMIRNSLGFLVPEVAKFFQIIQTDKQLAKFFRGAVFDTIEYREKNQVSRNDFMQILVQLVRGEGELTMDEAAAQAFVFFIGGMETTSSTLQFTFYELAHNQEIQDRMREEIMQALEDCEGKITYDKLFQLEYMGRVIEETVRKYPPAAALMRKANKDFEIPEMNFTIEKGQTVFISALGIQHDPRYYPDPKTFDPERFTDEEIAKRPKYTLLPFGEGPRFCIGQRFAYMQMRAVLLAVFSKYRIEECEKTPKVIQFDPQAFNLSPYGGMTLRITKI